MKWFATALVCAASHSHLAHNRPPRPLIPPQLSPSATRHSWPASPLETARLLPPTTPKTPS